MSSVEACSLSPACPLSPDSFILNSDDALEESDVLSNASSSSWVIVDSHASFISPESSQAIYSVEFTSPEILEPVLDNLAFFLAHLSTKKERERARITWRWIGMLGSTCKVIHNSFIGFVLVAMDAAIPLCDALAVSFVLKQTWRTDTGVYEAGVRVLMKMMSIATAPDR